MDDNLLALQQDVQRAYQQLKIDDLKRRLDGLRNESLELKFWQDSTHAGVVMQQIASIEKRIEPWLELKFRVDDLAELAKLKDDQLSEDISRNYTSVLSDFNRLRGQLLFSGLYDDHDALISISAGAGGTDAQDWTQMLFRMYSRFFDKNGWRYKVIDESPGEAAGLKNIVVEVIGDDFVYGKMRSEHGVHRLVRLSPFNADNLRQTSFAKVEVSPKIDSPNEYSIDERDLKIDVYRSGGHGGQSVNTTDSAVRITHLPSGISVAIQNERSQLQNKDTAMTLLRSRLAQMQMEQHAKKISDLKGPNQSAERGSQIRSYVLHPYKQVKDLRTRIETSDIDGVLAGEIDQFIQAYLEQNMGDTAD